MKLHIILPLLLILSIGGCERTMIPVSNTIEIPTVEKVELYHELLPEGGLSKETYELKNGVFVEVQIDELHKYNE